jgi:hypothetical protein
MSARIDSERRESAVEYRTDTAKERLRLAQMVLTCFVDGLGITATAARVGRDSTTVWRVRVWLGLQSGRQHRGTKRLTGRLKTRASIEAVTP